MEISPGYHVAQQAEVAGRLNVLLGKPVCIHAEFPRLLLLHKYFCLQSSKLLLVLNPLLEDESQFRSGAVAEDTKEIRVNKHTRSLQPAAQLSRLAGRPAYFI